jgi:antibiotic biosynthesis monooxygenase (ABM) superfamily enzyme
MSDPSSTHLTEVTMRSNITDSDDSASQGRAILEQRSMRSLIKNCPNDCQRPLTVFAKQKVLPENVPAFEKWWHELTQLQSAKFEGYLSSELISPMSCDNNEFISIFRYDNYTHLETWMESDERTQMLEKKVEFAEEAVLTSYHSLEHWFLQNEPAEAKSRQHQIKPPSRYKMVLLTSAIIWSEIQWVPLTVSKMAPNLNAVAAEGLSIFIITFLATFIFFPVTTRLLAFWLFPGADYRAKLMELVPSFLGKADITKEKATAEKEELPV